MTGAGVAIILAAGASTRMGRPKQLIALGDETMLQRTITLAARARLDPVVVLGARAEAIAPRIEGAEIVVHPGWAQGMGSSLLAGLRHVLAREPERLVVLLADQPLVRAEDLARLMDAPTEAAAAAYEGVLGPPACFRASCIDTLLTIPADTGARALLRGGTFEVTAVDMPRASIDVDVPDDLDHASIQELLR